MDMKNQITQLRLNLASGGASKPEKLVATEEWQGGQMHRQERSYQYIKITMLLKKNTPSNIYIIK